jgi:hypothetical protein
MMLVKTASQVAVQRALAETSISEVIHGTVTEVDTTYFIHQVQLDADSTIIRAHDVTQLVVNVGERVTVLFAPPHQALIIGIPRHDPWHIVGNQQQVPFNTGWTHLSGTTGPGQDQAPQVMFRRDGHMVSLRGTADRVSGTNIVIFTLPVGYRPQNRITMPALNVLGGHTYVGVTMAGNVEMGDTEPVLFHDITFTTL